MSDGPSPTARRSVLYGVFALGALAYLVLGPAGPGIDRGGEDVADAGASGEEIFRSRCAVCHGTGGSGGVGPALSERSLTSQFPDVSDQVAFVRRGSERGESYGRFGEGTGGMPSFRSILTRQEIEAVVRYTRGL